MATLEDKILGEKLEYYCSSSDDEDDGKSNSEKVTTKSTRGQQSSASIVPANISQWSGNAQNTGPKGVVQDWQLYKQLEAQQRKENEKQRLDLLKKFSMTANSTREDEERKKDEEIERELAELLEEDILQQFQKQRISEMMKKFTLQKSFGNVINLTSGDEFLSEVEKEAASVIVVIHIYENNIPACKIMNSCLETLAADYKHVKFCKISSSVAGTSLAFKSKGLPALLVYKGNELMGSFVRLSDELSDEFYASDVEGFLIEKGMIDDKNIFNVK